MKTVRRALGVNFAETDPGGLTTMVRISFLHFDPGNQLAIAISFVIDKTSLKDGSPGTTAPVTLCEPRERMEHGQADNACYQRRRKETPYCSECTHTYLAADDMEKTFESIRSALSSNVSSIAADGNLQTTGRFPPE